MRLRTSPIIATISAAALLVVGLDYTTYAATGSSLLLGRDNHAGKPTTISRHGRGVALSLKSTGHGFPSLRVSSWARVPRLNADLLDGKNAADLATNTVSYQAGKRGDVVDGAAFWRVAVAPGNYQVSFQAFVIPDAVAPGESVDVICGVADLATLGSNTTVYTAESSTYTNGFPTLMSGADTINISTKADPGIVCTTSTNTAFTLSRPVTASFTRVNSRTVRTAARVTDRQLPRRLSAPFGR